MDFLSHLFLPLTAAYVVWSSRFASPWLLGLAVFGLLPDLDKFLGVPGLLHSLLTLVPIGLAVLGIEYHLRGRVVYSPVIVALIGSHLLLDFVDGGPVPLLFPILETGVGLEYPARTVFGQGPVGLQIEGPLVGLRTVAPRPENTTYGFIQGSGVVGALLFAVVYLHGRWGRQRPGSDISTPSSGPPARPAEATDEESTPIAEEP